MSYPQFASALCRLFIVVCALLPSWSMADSGDIVFVTQVPITSDFANLVSTFANQSAATRDAPRGGDLWIRYADGTLKNLTQAAGYGMTGHQGANAIAVRDPAVHWSGAKVLFSMVVGSPAQYQTPTYRWQLYEMSGLGKNQTPVVTKVANQPAAYNNMMGTYGTDDRIIFITDRPRAGEAHLYPQRDEYESTATNTGLWSLNPQTGELKILDHAPSGVFHPFIDSYGRVIYTRWDHLQRDQQAGGLTDYGAFNFADESAGAQRIASQFEFYPEPRSERERLSATVNLHTFNHFFPWMINEDGTEHETLNHVGRHELHSYFDRVFNDDSNLHEFYGQIPRFNQNPAQNFFHLREHPLQPGTYFAINAPEFGTHASGQVVRLNGAPTVTADKMAVTYITHRDTSFSDDTPSADHSGLYRNPLPTTTGLLVVAHTSETRADTNVGTGTAPVSRYAYRLKSMQASGGFQVAGSALTAGIAKAVTYYDPDQLVTFSGNLWELQPVELVARTRPAARSPQIEAPEGDVFTEEGVDIASFKQFLANRSLALIVMRNVTSRDILDVQQPFNLRVTNTNTQKIPLPGKVYNVSHLQLFQGDLIRGYGGTADPDAGRRVLPVPLHDGHGFNALNPSGPAGSVTLASDGSAAAFVPASRALTWQLTDSAGEGVVRERYWLTFKPGEVRVCASCHGLNDRDQTGGGVPQNKPLALRQLLQAWKAAGGNPDPNDPAPPPPSGPEPQPPGGGDDDDDDDDDPAMSFAFQVTTELKRRQTVAGMFVGGKKSTIGLQSANALGANSTLVVSMAVDGTACPAQSKAFVSNASGYLSTRVAIPGVKRSVNVQLFASSGGTVVGSSTIPLLSGKQKESAKPLSAKDVGNICKAFAKMK